MKFGLSHRLRIVFRPKAGLLTGGWRKLSNEEFCNLCFLPNNMKVIRGRRVKWKGHVAPMKVVRISCRHLGRKTEGRCYWRDLGTNGSVKLYLKKSAQSGLVSSGSG